MKIRTLGLLTCLTATIAVAYTAALVAKNNTGVANGKEGTATANELVVAKTQTEVGQIGLGEIAQLAIVKEYPALVDTERVATIATFNSSSLTASSIASTDAFANAPNTATVPADQVAAPATHVTDQLALKCVASAEQFAFTATGALSSGSA